MSRAPRLRGSEAASPPAAGHRPRQGRGNVSFPVSVSVSSRVGPRGSVPEVGTGPAAQQGGRWAVPRRSPGRLRLDWTSEGCRRLWQGTVCMADPDAGSPPAGPSGGLTPDPVLIPRLSVSAQTLVLRGQSHSAASFLKCTQTQQAETCPATFCWTQTMTQRAPPCEEASAQPRPVHPAAGGGAGRTSAGSAAVSGRQGRPGCGDATSRGPTRRRG